MAKPEKDEVLEASAEETEGTAAPAAGASGTEAGADAEAVEAEVLDPEDDAPADEDAGEAAAAEPSDSEVVAQAKAEVAEWKDKYLRLHAEWDTYRRRTKEQREAEKVLATEKMVTSLLPVLDDFERTISYATENGETGLLDGVKAVQSKLMSTLEKGGVEVIDPAGEAFDALEAQAVATVEDPSVPDETVAQVYQKGYRMGTKVLRAAMVTVTTGGPKREKPAEADES